MDHYDPLIMTQVQRVFATRDLLGEILGHLAIFDVDCNESDLDTSRLNLFRVAHVSKAILDPALDLLWRSLDSFLPLARLLPQIEKKEGIYVLTSKVEESDWNRFFGYAQRVKVFTSSGDSPISSVLFDCMSQLWRSPLLPNLRRLRILDRYENTSGVFFLLTETIQFVDIKYTDEVKPSFVQSFLVALQAKVPALRSLSIKGKFSPDELNNIFYFKDLKTLDFQMPNGYLSSDFFRSLRTFSCLSNLDIYAGSLQPLQTEMTQSEELQLQRMQWHIDNPQSSSFDDTLSKLCIRGDITAVARVVSNLRGISGIRTITLKCRTSFGVDYGSLWSEIFADICSLSSVRDISIQRLPSFAFQLSSFKISPLYRITQLERLVVHASSYSATDDDIEELASSLPNLTVLHLPESWRGRLPTLRAIRALVRFCPKLKELQICVDLEVLLEADLLAIRGYRSNSPMETLIISTLPRERTLEAFIEISQYFDHLFPRLQNLRPCGMSNEDELDQVHRLIQAYQRAAFRRVDKF